MQGFERTLGTGYRVPGTAKRHHGRRVDHDSHAHVPCPADAGGASHFQFPISNFRHAVAAVVILLATLAAPRAWSQEPRPVFSPTLKTPEALAPFLAHVEAGTDDFASERDAEAIEARLSGLGDWLRGDGARPALPQGLFSPDFRGSAVFDDAARADATTALEIRRGPGSTTTTLDQRAMIAHLRRLAAALGPVSVTEFLVTAIPPSATSSASQAPPSGQASARQVPKVITDVRAEIVGQSPGGARASHVGTWRMTWQRVDTGWQIVEWTAGPSVTSRAPAPLFREITGDVVAPGSEAARQFSTRLDDWMARLDSVLTRDSNGHHGVSVGDADGDGLEDLYVAQPSGLPNRLLRARGDGTFEDVTDASGAGLLDDTAQSLFADVDNDGDQDLVLAMSLQPLLLINDGRGHFTVADKAFTFASPLQGVLTGITMADFDRDGFLDAYLCVYSYFFGAGEDKAGHAHALSRCPQRATGRPLQERRPRPLRRRHRAGGSRDRQRPLPLRWPRGPTTTMTAGPTCSSPTTSAPRTCIATSARRVAWSASRTSRHAPASSITAPA